MDFLMLSEDAAVEMANLTMKRQQLVLKRANQDRVLDQQIAQLDKLIMQKEQQQQAELKRTPQQGQQQQNPAQPNQQQPQPQGNRTMQPGSNGSQTPGSAPPMQR
jgi:hypothetical protein